MGWRALGMELWATEHAPTATRPAITSAMATASITVPLLPSVRCRARPRALVADSPGSPRRFLSSAMDSERLTSSLLWKRGSAGRATRPYGRLALCALWQSQKSLKSETVVWDPWNRRGVNFEGSLRIQGSQTKTAEFREFPWNPWNPWKKIFVKNGPNPIPDTRNAMASHQTSPKQQSPPERFIDRRARARVCVTVYALIWTFIREKREIYVFLKTCWALTGLWVFLNGHGPVVEVISEIHVCVSFNRGYDWRSERRTRRRRARRRDFATSLQRRHGHPDGEPHTGTSTATRGYRHV